MQLPAAFQQRLKEIIPEEDLPSVIASFSQARPPAVRINTLRIARGEALSILKEKGIEYKDVFWCENGLILCSKDNDGTGRSDLWKEGNFYKQGLSSQVVSLILSPSPDDHVLDMCAAPGSKTTHMAAMMDNRGKILALEAVKNRMYRLKSVIALLGAKNVEIKLTDARRFRSLELFDKILVDAPCSSEGRFDLTDADTLKYWSLRKIKEMRKKQKGLLLNASRLLKPGGVLVYSTCTFAPEENEEVMDWVLRKSEGRLRVVPVELKNIATYPSMMKWNKKTFDPQVKNCVRILPTEEMEGFFVAKLINRDRHYF